MSKIASYQLRKFVLLWLCVAGEADGKTMKKVGG
jgi:hypothetical protein